MVSLPLPEAATPALHALLRDYTEGLHQGDVARLRQAFHPQARLFGEVRGQPYEKSLEEYLAVVAGRASPATLGEAAASRLLALDIRGSIACARLHVPMLGFSYLDFLLLCRTGGRWQITSKLFTDLDPATIA